MVGKITANVLRLGGRFNAAKPLLYEVPTYLAGCPIGTLNRKTKRKKGMENLEEKILEIKKPTEVDIQGLGLYDVYSLEDVVFIVTEILKKEKDV